MPAPIKVNISAPAAPNPRGRYRGIPPRLWTASPTMVEVVDDPVGEGQISHASFARIQSDPLIKVEFVGGDLSNASAGSEVSAIKAELASALAKVSALQADVAAAGELMMAERARFDRDVSELARKVEAAENDAASLRARLSEAQAPKGKRG